MFLMCSVDVCDSSHFVTASKRFLTFSESVLLFSSLEHVFRLLSTYIDLPLSRCGRLFNGKQINSWRYFSMGSFIWGLQQSVSHTKRVQKNDLARIFGVPGLKTHCASFPFRMAFWVCGDLMAGRAHQFLPVQNGWLQDKFGRWTTFECNNCYYFSSDSFTFSIGWSLMY